MEQKRSYIFMVPFLASSVFSLIYDLRLIYMQRHRADRHMLAVASITDELKGRKENEQNQGHNHKTVHQNISNTALLLLFAILFWKIVADVEL